MSAEFDREKVAHSLTDDQGPLRTRPLSGPHGPARELRGACEVVCVVSVSFNNKGRHCV